MRARLLYQQFHSSFFQLVSPSVGRPVSLSVVFFLWQEYTTKLLLPPPPPQPPPLNHCLHQHCLQHPHHHHPHLYYKYHHRYTNNTNTATTTIVMRVSSHTVLIELFWVILSTFNAILGCPLFSAAPTHINVIIFPLRKAKQNIPDRHFHPQYRPPLLFFLHPVSPFPHLSPSLRFFLHFDSVSFTPFPLLHQLLDAAFES